MSLRIILFACLSVSLLLALGCQQETPSEQQETPSEQQETETPPVVEEKQPETPPSTVDPSTITPKVLLSEPVELIRVESIAEALPVWRNFADRQSALLLLSDKPQLITPPQILRDKVDDLAKSGSDEALVAAGDIQNVGALYHPGMSVDIAVRNAWFRELTWVIPTRFSDESPDLDFIRSQALEFSLANETEAQSLAMQERAIIGRLRDLPFNASALAWVQQKQPPVIVHIDLSYFQALYKNEIATPILQTIYTALAQLKLLEVQVLAVTFSYSHMDNGIDLKARFIGEILSTLLSQPELLDKPTPRNWQRQADAIYLSNFFQKEKVEELHRAQLEGNTNSAWVNFNLYQSSAMMNSGDTALEYLAKAVSLDPMYALEYAALSQLAYDRKHPDEALRMLTLAAKVFPDNPFIKLRMARLAIELNEPKTAQHLLAQLQAQTWSEVYHPEMPMILENMKKKIREESNLE